MLSDSFFIRLAILHISTKIVILSEQAKRNIWL